MNLKSLIGPIEEEMEAQLLQIDLLATANDVLENQIKEITTALTEAKDTIHSLNADIDHLTAESCEPDEEWVDYDADTINEEPQEEAKNEFDIGAKEQAVVLVKETVDSIIADTLIQFDSHKADMLTIDDLLKLVEFKRVWALIDHK